MTTPNPWPGNSDPSGTWLPGDADQPSNAAAQIPAPWPQAAAQPVPTASPGPALWSQNSPVQPSLSSAQKSKVTALILVIFVGSLGVHNFYLGHTGKGIAQLSLTVIGWITSFLLIGFVFLAIVGIWVLIELIQIATGSNGMQVDAEGVPLV